VALATTLGTTVAGVTLGERGSLAWDGERLLETPALPVAVVDTTGAGDVFHGALASCLVQGMALPEALEFAAAAAALACTAPGGRRGIAGAAAVRTLLRRRQPSP
jgi:sugar/nucleoside kinase (ribokinase family)